MRTPALFSTLTLASSLLLLLLLLLTTAKAQPTHASQSRDCAALEEFFAKGGVSPGKLWGKGGECCGYTTAGRVGREGRVECKGGRVTKVMWQDPPNALRLGGHLDSAPLTALSYLEYLSLSGNRLSGPYPSWPSKLPSLSHLDLSRNHLSSIPHIPGKALIYLNASENVLSGDLPDLDRTRLEVLDLKGNRLSGGVPVLPRSLRVVDISRNRLSGPLPPLPSTLQTCLFDTTVCNQGSRSRCGAPACQRLRWQDSGSTSGMLELADAEAGFDDAMPLMPVPTIKKTRRAVEMFDLQEDEDQDEWASATLNELPSKTDPRLFPRQTSPVPPPPPPSSSSLSTGAIVGIAVGGAVGLALLGVLLWFCLRPKPDSTSSKAVQMQPLTTQGASSTIQQQRPVSNIPQPAYISGVPTPGYASGVPQPAYPSGVPQPSYPQPAGYAAQQAAYANPAPTNYPGSYNTAAYAAAAGAATGTALAPTPSARRRAGAQGPASPDSPGMEGKKYIAVRPYAPQLNDEMVLSTNDSIIVLKVYDDGWAMGRNEVSKVEGLFPMACVMAMGDGQ